MLGVRYEGPQVWPDYLDKLSILVEGPDAAFGDPEFQDRQTLEFMCVGETWESTGHDVQIEGIFEEPTMVLLLVQAPYAFGQDVVAYAETFLDINPDQ